MVLHRAPSEVCRLAPVQELVGGRWEPFLSEIGREGVFYWPSDGMEALLSLRSQPQRAELIQVAT